MRIAIITDAWEPQVNGVVRTLQTTGRHLGLRGHDVRFVTPLDFRTVPCPTYPEIRLALWPWSGVARILGEFAPHAIHIATEGPLGHAAHRYCRARGLAFTTSFHTQFPEYINMRAPVPLDWGYAYLRRFHAAARRTMVASESLRQRLVARHFDNLRLWARGVDTSIFHPGDPVAYAYPAPIYLYMGRVAVEKNIEAFLGLELSGTKVVIGAGPDLDKLRREYPAVVFLGPKFGRDLARHVAGADVLAFPSRTDTFGLVMLEAMACGVPVAAFPVQGPVDVVVQGVSGVLDDDLSLALPAALRLQPEACVEQARRFSWERCTAAFECNLAVMDARIAA